MSGHPAGCRGLCHALDHFPFSFRVHAPASLLPADLSTRPNRRDLCCHFQGTVNALDFRAFRSSLPSEPSAMNQIRD